MWCLRSPCLRQPATRPRPPIAPWPTLCPSILAPASEYKNMPLPDAEFLSGEIFEECAVLTLADLSRMFAVDEGHIVELVEEGVLTVIEIDTSEWRFSGTALRRARIALRLERGLGINVPGVALALELLEELETLRRERKG